MVAVSNGGTDLRCDRCGRPSQIILAGAAGRAPQLVPYCPFCRRVVQERRSPSAAAEPPPPPRRKGLLRALTRWLPRRPRSPRPIEWLFSAGAIAASGGAMALAAAVVGTPTSPVPLIAGWGVLVLAHLAWQMYGETS